MRRFLLVTAAVTALACKHAEQNLPPPVDLGPTGVSASPSAPVASASAATVPVAPPPPPYDLDEDMADRRAKLKAEVGKGTTFEVVESVFLIASPNGNVGQAAVVSKAAIEAYFHGRFATRPERAVTVLLFDKAAPYDKWCMTTWGKACGTPFGFYAADVRTVVMNVGPGIGTLTHELVHPIVESDFPGAPDWINEGIASLFEAFSLPKKGEIHGNKNFRHPGLLSALRSKKGREWANLPNLFSMSDKTFRGAREGLNYSIARYFCMWMDGQNKLWPFYQRWRDTVATDPTGEKALVAVMGKTPSELDSTWSAWVQAL